MEGALPEAVAEGEESGYKEKDGGYGRDSFLLHGSFGFSYILVD